MTHHLPASTGTTARNDVLLRTLAPMDRGQLYDLAELLLAELLPGWGSGEDQDDDEDSDGDADFEDMEGDDVGAVDVVVDASYRACIAEAERYLVQCEGFDAEGSVVVGMRQHLNLARVSAAAAGPPRAAAHRPPGYP
ncbi:Hairy/enhancer-of-split related with YRPW motif protein 1 [Frankliniella fusca]|uniref:Hairy/enhancer-of-split related with YRPW motif protein 1 n=1 Tax=Frankliniella fusca TaxID=407009 RepID=A0AAE1HWF7_9NEOP|nr:Hairy/enhancer-of-split related with YRPW motif protein 1 [Frankliniella fusca]